jgi:hypothetical protein
MLSDRLRPDVECAPWVIKEIKKLEAEKLALCELIREAAPLAWAHGHSVAVVEDAYAWEKKAAKLLGECDGENNDSGIVG